MKLLNCSLSEFNNSFSPKKIMFFGNGSWLKVIYGTELMDLNQYFSYVVDNNYSGKTVIGDITLEVYPPKKLLEEKDCIIILTSPIYMYDMYKQLIEMGLDDNYTCYAFPFMQMVSKDIIDNQLLNRITNNKEIIPKIIHSFWFSGEEKPELYQKCIDSWKKILPDYEIVEWTKDNYDWHKHPFVERAIELKAWAFAADYARLDVLNRFGGIYLDMDVEVFKPFDDLLGNAAILAFSNHIMIDLAVIGAVSNLPLIKKLLQLYNKTDIPEEHQGFVKYFQPAFVRNSLIGEGIKMNGSLQCVNDVAVFPREFFMPQDHVFFGKYAKTGNTYCIHHDSFGWSFGKDSKREKKIRDNQALWDLIKNN